MTTKLTTKQVRNPVLFREHWDNIAYDLVLSRAPAMTGAAQSITVDEICREYGLTKDEMVALLAMPEFVNIVDTLEEMTEGFGVDAPTVLRARALASELMERMFMAAVQSQDPKELRESFKVLADIGRMMPEKKKDDVASGPQVVINVPPGIPGMEHIYDNKPTITIENDT